MWLYCTRPVTYFIFQCTLGLEVSTLKFPAKSLGIIVNQVSQVLIFVKLGWIISLKSTGICVSLQALSASVTLFFVCFFRLEMVQNEHKTV